MFLSNRSMFVAKLEKVPYTAEDLVSADFDIEVENLSWTTTVNEFQRKLHDGTLDASPSVMGKQMGGCSFMTEMNSASTVDVLPRWDKFLLICGFARAMVGGTAGVVTTVDFTVGNIIRYSFSGTPDLSGVNINSVMKISGCVNASNNGDFIVVAVDDGGDTIDVYNPLRADDTDDETGLTASGTYTPTAYTWTLDSHNTHIPATINCVDLNSGASPKQMVTKMCGVMGNVTFTIGEVGEPIQMNFELQGSLLSVTDRDFNSLLVPTGVSTVQAPAVLGADVTVAGLQQCMNQFEVNVGNSLQNYTCSNEATGIKGSYVGSRETVLTLDPIADLVANEDVYGKLKAGTTGALEVKVNGVDTLPDLKISAPVIQHTGINRGDRDESVTWEKSFRVLKSSGDDSLVISQETFA